MYITLIISCIFFVFPEMEVLHDIHVSKTELNYKTEKKILQISVHIYADDLEKDIINAGFDNLKLNTLKEHKDADSLLSIYINEHLIIWSGKQRLAQYYIGKEASEDLSAVWCYIEVPLETSKLTIENTILLDIHDDQRNLVSIKVDGKRNGFYILDKENNSKILLE